MCESLKIILGAFLATLSGYLLFWFKMRADARSKFLGVTAGLRAQLDIMQHTDEDFFAKSMLLLGQAVYEVRWHLWPWKRQSINQIWDRYTNENKSEFGTKVNMLAGVIRTQRTPKQRLYDYLTDFEECVGGKRRRDRWSYAYLIAGLYVASCLIIYFGIAGAIADYGDTHIWKLTPDTHLFERLLSAALTLVSPLFVAFFLMWALVCILGIAELVHDLIQRCRRKNNAPRVTKHDPPA